MKKLIGKKMGIIFVSFMFISLYTQTSVAVDELSLTGFVKSIDKTNGIISINVTSESCRGLRVFRVPDDARNDLDASLIGRKLQFDIDSATCERGKVYTIISKEQP
jgi:hypothetical protein